MTDADNADRLLAEYLTVSAQHRVEEVAQALGVMTKRERQLVKEAAVMGYVRGLMAGQGGQERPPRNSAVLVEVVSCCVNMSDLYPVHARMARLGVRKARKARSGREGET